jgi:hypothetical protein
VEQVVVQPQRHERWPLSGIIPFIGGVIWLLLLWLLGSSAAVAWSAQSLPMLLYLLLTAGALYLLPGWALLRLCWATVDRSWTEEMALACGISIGLTPLLLQAAHLLHIPWTSSVTFGYVGAVLFLLAVTLYMQPQKKLLRSYPMETWHWCMLLGSISVAILARLYVVRDLPVGMWADSYHHTMITQLLVDNRGLFSSWEPYAPLTTFTYHYGFHANAAFFHWLTGLPVSQSVIYAGQFINIGSLLSAYVLTTRLTGNRHAGLWVLMLTAFVNTLPAFYVNWGRYTQLTGQVILPVVLISWMVELEVKAWNWRRSILAVVTTASLMFTHYIVTIFAVLFLGIYVLLLVARTPRWPDVRLVLGRSIVIASLAVLLASPWLFNTLQGHLTRNLAGYVIHRSNAEYAAEVSNLMPMTPFYLKGAILMLAVLGVFCALARRTWWVGLFAVWTLLLILVAIPHVFGLPGAGVVTVFASYIALYLTVIPLAAYALSVGQDLIIAWWPRFGYLVATAVLVAVSIWGLRWQQHLLDPKHQIFWPADAKAMEWIRANAPVDALFLVNMEPGYGGTMFVGTDGGWWIPLLTQRQSTLPPMTYGSELAASPDYSQQINEFAFALREHPLPSDKGIRLARETGIDYIYVGAHSEQRDKIDAEALRQHPAFRVVYEHEGVVIFALE